MERKPYPTDLTDEQWTVLEPLLERPVGPGRPTRVDLREIINALRYQARTGCQWRLLPHDCPDWTAVRYYCDGWTRDGPWEAVNQHRVELVRQKRGRRAPPTAALSDSQRVKTTEAGGERGCDGGQQGAGAPAALPGGHRRAAAGRAGRGRESGGSGRGALAAQWGEHAVARTAEAVGRSGVSWRRLGRLAARRVWHRPRNRGAARGSGRGCGATPPVGRGTVKCLAPSEPALEQGLRAAGRVHRNGGYLSSIPLLLQRLCPRFDGEPPYARKAA